ncbi:DNA sulfur modification protein DndB [Flavobacterium humi]|uniref:DGQHR domain-containing protein n=1 Tax=Flavobacterium humi TaxID=2562683 RepID=A0A4Z0LB70_9FLAO|nr:DNA sulfur modification protein DndB [Flavobacterium humi]TGD58987.1 DGQHR domain-containing protein [Flavobacterium humi]
MKIPALKANIGSWNYYVTTLTFEQISIFVSKIDDQLYKSESLQDLIQRSITNNYVSIKEYILNQPDVFFNSLVLAVYDDYPDWREIEFKYESGEETYQMGLLEFPSNHKVFPVDGQHRVEGIKASLLVNPQLKDQKIAAIFIGHKNDEEGKQKTRRLFTTLNRYAKPVSLDDIIALDEDDSVAIVTRYLLEEYELFAGKRIIYAKQKAIPPTNKEAITSIITLYQANLEIFKIFYEAKFEKKATQKLLIEYLKFRPSNEIIHEFTTFTISFWDAFKTELAFISEYLIQTNSAAQNYRNNDTGGNLVFRPIGFLPLVKSSLLIYKREGKSFTEIFQRYNNVNFNLDTKPWHYVAWNPIEHKMVMSSDSVIQLLLLYLYNSEILEAKETKKLKEGYAAKISYENPNLDDVLNDIQQ